MPGTKRVPDEVKLQRELKKKLKALKELVRVSNKYLVISVPNEPLFMLAQLLRGKNWSRLGNDIEHINHWTFVSFPKFVKVFVYIMCY